MSVVLITGCSTGIGYETALAFARNGDTVIATMRDVSKATALQAAASAEDLSIEIEQLDVRDDDSVSAAVSAVTAGHGGVDVLVNNAGVSPMSAFELMPPDEVEALFDTNFFGALRMVRAVVSSMRERGSGTILNVSSIVSRIPGPTSTMYAASKAALSAFSEGLAQELHPFGIRVAAFELGQYATPIVDKTISTLSEQTSPYANAERRMHTIIQQGVDASEDPADAAALLVATTEADTLESFRILVGEGAKMFAEGRASVSDQYMLEMVAAETDEEYFTLFAQAFAPAE
jgi:NAD(P)-dependent dehydrogenase (short-subunit alcohol dehydrogenase family)